MIDRSILTLSKHRISLDKIMPELPPITTLRLSTTALSIRDLKSTRIRPKTIHLIRTRKTFLKGNCKDKLSQGQETGSPNNLFLMSWLPRLIKKRCSMRGIDTINSILRTLMAQTQILMGKRK